VLYQFDILVVKVYFSMLHQFSYFVFMLFVFFHVSSLRITGVAKFIVRKTFLGFILLFRYLFLDVRKKECSTM